MNRHYIENILFKYTIAVRETQTKYDNLFRLAEEGFIVDDMEIAKEWTALQDKEESLHKEVMEHIFGGNDESR